jgi:hypothetical protein
MRAYVAPSGCRGVAEALEQFCFGWRQWKPGVPPELPRNRCAQVATQSYPWRGIRGRVELANDTQAIALASLCNYVAFKDLTAKPGPEYLIQPLLLRTARSCGDANLFYTQKGEQRFRFALQAQAQADSARFGEEHQSPLLCHVAQGASPASASLPDRLSFGRVSPDNVQLAVVKKAEAVHLQEQRVPEERHLIVVVVEGRAGPLLDAVAGDLVGQVTPRDVAVLRQRYTTT